MKKLHVLTADRMAKAQSVETLKRMTPAPSARDKAAMKAATHNTSYTKHQVEGKGE